MPKRCKCHGEPMVWHKDARCKAGGFWRCAVKRRESWLKYDRTVKRRESWRKHDRSDEVRERKRKRHGARPGEAPMSRRQSGRLARRVQTLRADLQDPRLMRVIEAVDPRRAKLMRLAGGATTPWERREAMLQLLKYESNPIPRTKEEPWQHAVPSAETRTPLPLPRSV